ncbi:MAG: xanthine dehydrogenase family protein molybdopterin-binding subunit [Bacteroidetes bacterium]|nr:MAG: xanthine dehydrogenase family protein molybdopterin-binding subunit [Bacteroidota bacterium]
MARINTTLNRRAFLKASALAGGGLMLGFNWAGCAPSEPPVKGMPDTWADINAYLKIGNNGLVTIMSPNPEIGQNVKTSMPMIVAEELDVDWKDVIVEQAPLDTHKFTRQLAGGSQSIRQGWRGLRLAGATARRMLLEAAAQRWQVPVEELTTKAGVIHHEPSGRTLGYGDVAADAAGIPVPEDVALKDPRDFTIIGTTRKNVDGPAIVTGKPLFGLDTQREGMLIAMIEHPPAFGMTIKSLNAEAAKAMPGIHDVFTIDAAPDGFDRQWSDVNAFPHLVVVVGRSTWEVLKAKQALKVEWEVASPLESSADHTAGLARLLREGRVEPARRDGNPEAAFRRAATVIERTYSAPFLAHNTMEPMNFFADVKPDRAELLGPIQTPEFLRRSVASVLGLPEDRISIQMTRMGGGFGRRLYGNFGVEAALISQKVQAPVKLVYTREDDMTQGTYRPAYQVTYRAALDDRGRLIAFHVRGAGVHGGPVFADRFPAGAVEHYLAEDLSLESNVSTGAWRAPRSNFIAGAEQMFLDEVAEAAGKDPIDFRLELFDRAMNDPVGEAHDYDAERYAGVLRLVREKSGWDTPRPGVHRGVSAYYCHNSYVAQVVDVVVEDNRPRVQKVWCAVDCGIVVNPGAARNQVEGGIVDGIGHAMYSALSFVDGVPEQKNFDRYRLIRNAEAPKEIETFFVDNGIDPTGLGEPSLPPVIGALANALARATGQRLYDQPFITSLQGFALEGTTG